MTTELTIVGGGLAGCEAAWQAANQGIPVVLYEMRPYKFTEAHRTALLAELICSNSLGSIKPSSANGLLYHEMKAFNSLICQAAEATSVPAGTALAVDRYLFAQKVTEMLSHHPHVRIVREEVTSIPLTPTIIATGPLTSPALTKALQNFHGEENLFFYDAIAPIIEADSIDMHNAFWGSRYGKENFGNGDYLNCPLDKPTYENFIDNLVHAKTISLRSFEEEIREGVEAGQGPFFEGCLPIETLANRGLKTLAYGPLRPVGLHKSYHGERPYAVVQLRQEDLSHDVYNMVGFQTNLTISEQKRVFRLIPALQNAEFVRYGQMHRNTFLFAPTLINEYLQSIHRPNLFFAGQLVGVEGYLGNAASGLVAGINAAKFLQNESLTAFPRESMIGAICFYISHANREEFQPIKANFGILPPLETSLKNKAERNAAYVNRSLNKIKSMHL